VRWSIRVGTLLVRVLGATWRVRQVGDTGWRERQRAGLAVVLGIWHGDLLPAIWGHRGEGIVMLVSEHSDGEIITRIGAALGQRAVRGSTTRGGARALLSLVRLLRDGVVVALTPDGPRGPRHVAQQGVVAAAQRADAPVVAIGLGCSRQWQLSSWDRFRIPGVFARVVLAYSAPLDLSGLAPDEALAAVSRALAEVGALAQQVAHDG
jgi:lysophospholipid acyltransferase (LPLAT)-like uncharacterized protein